MINNQRNLVSIKELAVSLNWSENTLLMKMRDDRILQKGGGYHNIPSLLYRENDYFINDNVKYFLDLYIPILTQNGYNILYDSYNNYSGKVTVVPDISLSELPY